MRSLWKKQWVYSYSSNIQIVVYKYIEWSYLVIRIFTKKNKKERYFKMQEILKMII